MSDWSCPGCGSRGLEPLDDRAASLCAGCGGAWLDNAASMRLLQLALSDDVLRAARQADGRAPEEGYREASRPGERSCPICGEGLGRTVHGGVTLDVCGHHGTFFDRGELVTIHDGLRARKDVLDEAAVLELKKELADARGRDLARSNWPHLADLIDLFFRW